jgi:hypothetical protein
MYVQACLSMCKNLLLWCLLLSTISKTYAQITDSSAIKTVTLAEIRIANTSNARAFIEKIKNDSSFYKAFRNLRVLSFSSLNNIVLYDKRHNIKASMTSKTHQIIEEACRLTQKIEETTTGDFYDEEGKYNYYTAELYASLFFAFEKVCGETNIVKGYEQVVSGKTGIDKSKAQLKMLFFNPGAKIPGIPLMGNKAQVFDEHKSRWYNYSVDIIDKMGNPCYLFTITAKTTEEGGNANNIVIDKMTTVFDCQTLEVLSRKYSLSYDAGLYAFDVEMEVELNHYKNFLVPTLIRYIGNWRVIGKKKENGVFTATLFDFK